MTHDGGCTVLTTRCLWVSLSFATFGLVVHSGHVVEAPSIAGWTRGRPEREVVAYYRARGAWVQEVPQ